MRGPATSTRKLQHANPHACSYPPMMLLFCRRTQDCVTNMDNLSCTAADLPAVTIRHAACQLYVEQGSRKIRNVDTMIGMKDAQVKQSLTCKQQALIDTSNLGGGGINARHCQFMHMSVVISGEFIFISRPSVETALLYMYI